MPIDWDYIRIIIGFLSIPVFFLALRSYYPGLFPKLWFIFRAKYIKLPFRKSPMVMEIIKKEEVDSKKQKYETFEAFLKDCPKYQIASGTLDVMIRNIYRSAGVRFQQYVFIDPASPIDKTAWLRVVDDSFIHDKGTYFRPCKSEKDIIYYKYKDSRPLIDLSDEIDWKNPDAFAEVITGLTNENTMKGYRESLKDTSNYVLVACVIIILLIAFDIYTGDTSNKNIINLLTKLTEQAGIKP